MAYVYLFWFVESLYFRDTLPEMKTTSCTNSESTKGNCVLYPKGIFVLCTNYFLYYGRSFNKTSEFQKKERKFNILYLKKSMGCFVMAVIILVNY